jgi:glyoxylase I family protein
VKIEHVAFQVADPVAVASWYVEHLGMSLKRSFPERPWGQFLADDGDSVMLEFYNNPRAAVPDYRALDPLLVHVAFTTDDVQAARARLLAAGATAESDVTVTDSGDSLMMLRDPWGLPIQFIRRKVPMI